MAMVSVSQVVRYVKKSVSQQKLTLNYPAYPVQPADLGYLTHSASIYLACLDNLAHLAHLA